MNAQGILLLAQDYRPLRVIPVKRAVGLILNGRAAPVSEEFVEIHSSGSSMQVPFVLRLEYAVKIPFKRDTVPCTRRGVLARDGYECQFVTHAGPCSATATTIDHVHPKSKGGERLSWDNLVAACAKCNHKKSDRSLKEMGWFLKRQPFAPKAQMRILGNRATLPEAWKPYLVTV
jgi:5-methylcytosine-specific restriction endonuclease McrA